MESLWLTLVVGFITTLTITPHLKSFLEKIGLVATDMQKKNKPKMAASAGIPLSIGFLVAIMGYVFITTFITKAQTNLTLLFASTTTVLISIY